MTAPVVSLSDWAGRKRQAALAPELMIVPQVLLQVHLGIRRTRLWWVILGYQPEQRIHAPCDRLVFQQYRSTYGWADETVDLRKDMATFRRWQMLSRHWTNEDGEQVSTIYARYTDQPYSVWIPTKIYHAVTDPLTFPKNRVQWMYDLLEITKVNL